MSKTSLEGSLVHCGAGNHLPANKPLEFRFEIVI